MLESVETPGPGKQVKRAEPIVGQAGHALGERLPLANERRRFGLHSHRDTNRVSLPLFRLQERKLLLGAVDAAIAVGCTLFAYDVWRLENHPVGGNMTAIPWMWVCFAAVSWVAISSLAGSYELDAADQIGLAARRTFAVGAAAAVEGLFFYWIFLKTYPRPALAIALVCTLLGTLVWRAVYAHALGRAGATRTLLLGDRSAFDTLSAATEANRSGHCLVAHVLPEVVSETDFAETHDTLLGLVQERHVHRIVVGPRISLTGPLVSALISAIENGVEVFDFTTAYEEIAAKVAVEHVGREWLAQLPTRPLTSSFEEAAMRLLDLTGAIVGAAVTLALLPFIGLAVFLSSPGPIFYSQERIGRGGKPFTIYKFRSMAIDAESAGEVWAHQRDPRITRLGRYLRGSHLDELPQFWNVLRGEMSLVGPRPERPDFTDLLAASIPYYRLRLAVRPGMTGLKQIKFGYAATEEEHLEVLRHDLYYLKHRSLLLNLQIIARTLGSLGRFEGR